MKTATNRSIATRVKRGARSMLELVLFVIAYFVVVNFVFPRIGIQPG